MVEENARANAVENCLAAEIATRSSLEEQLQSLQCRYDIEQYITANVYGS